MQEDSHSHIPSICVDSKMGAFHAEYDFALGGGNILGDVAVDQSIRYKYLVTCKSGMSTKEQTKKNRSDSIATYWYGRARERHRVSKHDALDEVRRFIS